MNIDACSEYIILTSLEFKGLANPTCTRDFLRTVLFDLLDIKTWRDMLEYVERYSPYWLPCRKGSASTYDYLVYGDYALDRDRQHAFSIDGNIGNARFDLGLSDAETLLDSLLPIAQSIQAVYQQKTPLIDKESITSELWSAVESRQIVSVEEILKNRDILFEVLWLYSVAIGDTPETSIANKFIITELGEGLVRIQYPCTWLTEKYAFGDDRKKPFAGNSWIYSPFDGSITLEELDKLDIMDKGESIVDSCFYLYDTNKAEKGDSALLYGARKVVKFFVNAHLDGKFGTFYQPKMGDSLHFEPKDNPNGLFDQVWHEVALMIDERMSIGTCKQCRRPLNPTSRSVYCSDTCKTNSTNRRRDLSIKFAASGVPLEDAVSQLGEKYRNSIERWYAETLGTNPAR